MELLTDRNADYGATASGNGAYCNCSGFLLSLPRDKSRILYEKTAQGFLFAKDEGAYYSLFAVGRFPDGITLDPLDKPVIFTHAGGDMPTLKGFSFFRSSVRMDAKDLPECSDGEVAIAKPDDADEILSLLRGCMPIPDIPSYDELLRLISGGWVYIIKENDRILSVASAEVRGRRCTVAHVASHPDARGKGYAKRVLLCAMNGARERGALLCSLWVDAENERAVKLYERLGFSKIGGERRQWRI